MCEWMSVTDRSQDDIGKESKRITRKKTNDNTGNNDRCVKEVS